MDDTQLSNLINTIENSIANGIRVQLGNDFNGPINLDVHFDSTNFGVNVNGYITVENPETLMQSYRKLLYTLLEARNLPNSSKRLLRDDLTIDNSIDQLIKLIQNEIEKEVEYKMENKGLN